MGTMASQITSLTIVYSTIYSDADQRTHQSSASLAFVWGIHRGAVNSPHKWPVTRNMFPFDDVIMYIAVMSDEHHGMSNHQKPKIVCLAVCSVHQHADVIKWKHFPRNCPFVRGIHRSPVNSLHKGQWCGAFMFFFDLCLNKRLNKQSWGWWFETPSCPLWRHRNERAHQTSMLLAFVKGNHSLPLDSLHREPVIRKIFFRHVLMMTSLIPGNNCPDFYVDTLKWEYFHGDN